MTEPATTTRRRRTGAALGTFAGVFTPSILTILGIILFLRTGFVVGNAGLAGALVILAIATTVSVLTSISLAAISTNIDVGPGGDYYVISRTLGVEYGGAIGVVLFVAQSVSIGFYAIGFAEATTSFLGWESQVATQVLAAVAILALFAFAWAGADVATRLQFAIMTILVLALLSFFIGAVGDFDSTRLSQSWTSAASALGFWGVFAIFFPAVTGFTQGVSMSGDLRQPARSLPAGTFAAVGVSTVVYAAVFILLAGGVPLAVLVDDDGSAMRQLAAIGALVGLGVVAATLSSAMASFLGGPRILQAMAADRVFPYIDRFEKGDGPANNPRRAVLVSLVIALLTVLLGSVNVIAPVVSMFFLISYGLINYATYFEARSASPSFRPRFRYYRSWVSLAGAILCAAVMVLINPVAGMAAILALFGIYQYLRTRDVPERWIDASQSHHFQRAVESIRAMDDELMHPRNWRPQVLVFSGEKRRRERLLRFAKWVEGNSGLTAVFHIVVGEGIRRRIEADRQQEELVAEIDALGLDVHARTVLAANGLEALPVVIQSFGVGRLRSNVVLFGWPESTDEDRLQVYLERVREVARLGVGVISLSTDEARWQRFEATPAKERRIDVWWEDNDSGRLALLAAYLCTRAPEWGAASIRLVAASNGGKRSERQASLVAMLDEARIDAKVEVLPTTAFDRVEDLFADATVVLMPMHLRRGTILDPSDNDLLALVGDLPMTAAFHAAAPIVLETDPSSGIAREIADAEDAAQEARERSRKLEEQLDEAHRQLESMAIGSATEDDIARAEETLERIHRRAASARARVERTEWEASEVRRRAR
ncbi:MAG: amino acid permease [Acidimicrobiia bacterium]|nr:amino acid permease [Acidimicrobiia bacterium]